MRRTGLLVLLLLAGCGTTTDPVEQKAAVQAAKPEVQSSNYDDAKAICSRGVREVARQLHVKATREAAAGAWSENYRPAFRDSVYQGCLAGFGP